MKIKSIVKAIIIVSPFYLASCVRYYYVPKVQVPLFTEEKQLRVGGSIGGSITDENNIKNIQAAYSITNDFAVMANYMNVRGEYSANSGRGNYYDAAFGYYKPLGEKFVFEVFGGLGHSKQWHYEDNYTMANLSFRKIFVQPSIGFTSKYFDFAFTPSFSNVSYYNIHNYFDKDSQVYPYFAIAEISSKRNYFFYEPTATMRVGWKYGKIQWQFIWIKNHTSVPNLAPIVTTNIGLVLFIDQKILKKYTEK